MRQRTHFLATTDGARLAWATTGRGPDLVSTGNWLSHIAYDMENPVWRHWLSFFAESFRVIRYDERGCGLSDKQPEAESPARFCEDALSVVKAAKLTGPFVLLGISHGVPTAIQFAVRYPQLVSHLILYGGYSRGWEHYENKKLRRQNRAIGELTELGWSCDNPMYRNLFTSLYIPDASPEQARWLNDMRRRTVAGSTVAGLMRAAASTNIDSILSDVHVPTIVFHANEDGTVPIDESRRLAAGIPGAEFVQLESRNHIILEHEQAWKVFKREVLTFVTLHDVPLRESVVSGLSAREREILSYISAGLTNPEIGRRLFISEKTVRNTVTRLFRKLGVRSRTEAAILAKDDVVGFRGENAA